MVASFVDREVVNVLVIALTQSGKTGTMFAFIKKYLKKNDNVLPIENIYIITGLSSKEWVKQTKERLPESLEKRVIHRGKLNENFVKEIREKENILIIIDEIQIAAKPNQTLYKRFHECGLYDKENLLKRDIKIAEFSATPDGVVCDVENWGGASEIHIMKPGEGYTSCFMLMDQNRVRQSKDLYCYDKDTSEIDYELVRHNVGEIKDIIDKFENPMYHIIRTPKGSDIQEGVINNFKRVFGEGNMNTISYTQDSEINDINDILKKKPKIHTFIFIKEMLRCAKTITKTYLGILYERNSQKPDDAVMIQGLLGRNTGYEDNGKSIVFTNISSIKKYENMWRSKFKDRDVEWVSKTTQFKRKILSSKGTFVSPTHFDSSDSDTDEVEIPKIEWCSDWQEVKNHFKRKSAIHIATGSRGPNTRTPNPAGFYECITQHDKTVKVRSKSEFDKMITTNNWGFRGKTQESLSKNKFRVYPCYEDTKDLKTLKWLIVYYK